MPTASPTYIRDTFRVKLVRALADEAWTHLDLAAQSYHRDHFLTAANMTSVAAQVWEAAERIATGEMEDLEGYLSELDSEQTKASRAYLHHNAANCVAAIDAINRAIQEARTK